MGDSPTDRENLPPDELQPSPLPASGEVREIDSRQLFLGEKTIVIRHGEEVYRLLVTRHNRLILQK